MIAFETDTRGLNTYTNATFQTYWGQPDDKLRSFEAGFDEHLTKPVDSDFLSDLINGTPAAERLRDN